MARKLATYKGYDTLNTYYSDSSLLSPDIFDISFFPNKLTVGKNLIKFRGNLNSLKIGAPIDVEILDSNGDPIYSEFIDFIDQDGSRVLSIYIYEDTAPGDATIIFVTEITKINDQQIPNDFQNQLNAKWTRTIPVNPLDLNTSTVIFDDLPKVTISENVGVQLNRTYANGQFPIYNTGQISFVSQNNQPTAILTGGKFNGDMINGTLSVPTPSNPLPTSDINASSNIYTSTISKVLNDTTLQLDFPYEVFDTQSNLSHTFNSFDNSAFQIEYEATPQYTPTQNSESFALIQISDLEPDTGDISRIKVYLNSAGTVGTFEQVNDILLPNTEIFIDSTSSLTPDKSIGIFETQNIIDTYWEGHSYQGKTEIAAPTLTWTTSSINNATAITGTLDLSNSNNVYTFQLKNQFSGIFVSQSIYTVTLDAFTQKSGNINPILSIYASGSAFTFDSTDNFNQELPKKLGKKIGEIECLGTSKRYDDISFEFNSDQSGTGVLIFVVESGDWQFSDIRTLTDAEYGYTPNYTRFRTEIPTKIKSGNQLSFKIEYYNRLGDKSNTVNFVRNLNFEGGNRYIDGGFSMLTGSLFVADTLSSGVEIAGLQNTGYVRSLGYEGFNQATGSGAGGFLLFSGSALPQQSETTYQGVGLEMVSDANNYFKYRTNPSILDVHTETFFLGNPSTQFVSGSSGQLEISSSGYHIQANGDITASRFLMDGGTITDNVTILGSLSANSILTPATINGSPSTPANASSSISTDGLAIFKSASIAGFTITGGEIISAGAVEASSSITNTNVSLTNFSLAGSIGVTNPTISSQTYSGSPTDGYGFSGYVSAGSPTFKKAGVNYSVAPATYTVGDSTITLTSGYETGDPFGEGAQSGFSFYQTNAPSNTTFLSGSTTNFPAIESPIVLKALGEITASAGKIGGFQIGTSSLSTAGVEINDSSQNSFISSSNFNVKHTGIMTASNALFEGVALANIIRDKAVVITAANSSSYLQFNPQVGTPPSSTTAAFYNIVLDGSLGGEKVRRALIGCPLKTISSGGGSPTTYTVAIAGIKLPDIGSTTSLECIIEISGSGIAFRNDVGPFAAGFLT
jgi:hypothetical protein